MKRIKLKSRGRVIRHEVRWNTEVGGLCQTCSDHVDLEGGKILDHRLLVIYLKIGPANWYVVRYCKKCWDSMKHSWQSISWEDPDFASSETEEEAQDRARKARKEIRLKAAREAADRVAQRRDRRKGRLIRKDS